LFLGWTFIGWVIFFAMSLSGSQMGPKTVTMTRQPVAAPAGAGSPSGGISDALTSLATLKEEYQAKRSDILGRL